MRSSKIRELPDADSEENAALIKAVGGELTYIRYDIKKMVSSTL
jgi:hypothetical protein